MGTDFTRPTTAELLEQAQTDVEGELTGVNAQLRRRPERALAMAPAGLADGLHDHLDWNADQIIPDKASDAYVVRWAELFGLTRKPAVPAQGTIAVTGTGGNMLQGALWVRLADGATFSTDADANAITASTVAVTAVTPGAAGDTLAGQTLQLVSPISGVDSIATINADIEGGTDQETIPALLERLLDRLQRPPMGGAPGDHVTWALEVPGVTRAWEYGGTNGVGNQALGKVALTFVCDGDGDILNPSGIIPDNTKVAEVQAYLDARSSAEVIVFAPTPVAFDYTVTLTPNGDPLVEPAVEAEIYDLLARDAVPGGTIKLSHVNEAISEAEGETDHVLTLPAADVTHAFGEIAIYGTPVFS
jgi:uncharacterized phage protein gp47/JayE